MKLSWLLPLCGLTLAAAPASAQQSDLHDLAATDAGLIEGEVLQNPAFAWSSLTANLYNRSRPGGSWVGTKYYLIGGELSSGQWGFTRADTVEIFDGITGGWTSSASSMPTPVSNIMGSTAAVGSKIYVFGGYDENAGYSDQVQIYDTLTDSWSVSPASIPTGGLYGMLAVNSGGGGIFCCGGRDAAATTRGEAYIYDTATDTFNAIAPMPTPRFHLTGDITGTKIYVPGGFGTGTAFEMYDLATATWTTLPALPVDRAGCGVIAAGRYCVMFGGDWSGYRSDATVYDAFFNNYNPTIAASLGNMPTGKRAFAYGPFKSLALTAFVAIDGWAGAYLDDCAAIQ